MRVATAVALSIVLAAAVGAQGANRPKIARGADPNDWEAYYDAGLNELHRDVVAAESSFVYAARLRPDRAEPLFALWIAFWARDIPRFQKYLEGDEKILRDPAVLRAESFRYAAMRRNPFVHQGPVMYLYDRLPGRFRDDAATRAWIALGRAELPRALETFGRLVERDPKRYGYFRFVRASAFVNLGRMDSAMAQISALLAQLRAQDTAVTVSQYQSKELLEYSLGLLYLQSGRPVQAREALGRAVVENAAFAPAHAMLGMLSLTPRHVENALTDLGLALEIDSTDVEFVMGHGRALLIAKRADEAVERMRRATELEPLYATPHYWLGMALEQSGDSAAAIASYRQFLQRAVAADPLRATVERKVQASP